MGRHRALVLGASAIALTMGAFGASGAYAAAASGSQGASTIEEVVVTARRREENVQAVPVSVTAVTGATLSAKGVTNVIELARQVPNVTIGGASTNSQLLTIGVRGIRQKEGHMFFDPSVVTIFNDAVVAHPYGFGDTMYDLQSVEILKGPQGTLFGRNSPAGALIVNPNLASIAEGFHGSAGVSFGTYSRQKYDFVVNVPVNDKVAFRIAAEHFQRDGYVTNILTGQKWNGVGNDSVRASLTLQPTEHLRNTTVVDYLVESSSPPAIIQVAFLPGGTGSLLGGPANAQALLAQQQALGPWRFASFGNTGILPQDVQSPSHCAPGSTTPFQFLCDRPFNSNFWMRTYGVVNTTTLDIGDAQLKNIFSYRHFTRDTWQSSWNAAFANGTGGPGNFSITGSPDGIKTLTDELQISGKSFGERLNWVGGVFAMTDKGQERNTSFQGIGVGIPTTQNYAPTTMNNNSLGLYAQGTFAVTDRFNLTGGVRWSYDHKKVTSGSLNYNVFTGLNPLTGCAYFDENNVRLPPTIAGCLLHGDRNWSAITWNFSADYKVVDGTMVYAQISRGYRSGSFFPRAIRPSLFSYNPEFVLNYETGIKSDWSLFDRPLRTNLSIYMADQSNMQVQVQDVTTVPLSGYINNAAKARYEGGEFEATFRPTDALTLTSFASYTAFKYSSYVDNTGVDLSYQTAPEPISHWNIGGSADYRFDMAESGALDLRADVTWVSKIVTNNIFPNAKGDWPGPAYTNVNLRAEWERFFGKPVDIAFWVTNATNTFYSNGGTCLSGICYIVPSPPRMWGVDVKYHF